MHVTTVHSFTDELRKIKSAGVMEDAAHEGIALAKKLHAKNLVGGLKGNVLKDYHHHMDLSAHPKFMGAAKLKVGGLGQAALEVGGLGMLAKNEVGKLKDPNASERKKAKWELGGLGVLAAHPAYEIGKHLVKRGSITDGALLIFKKASPVRLGVGAIGKHMLGDAFKAGTKPATQAVARAAKPMAQMATAGGRAGMLHSFTPASQVNMSRAISL